MEARSPKIKLSAELILPEGWERKAVPYLSPSFGSLLALFIWPSLANKCLHVQMVFSCEDTIHIGLGAYTNPEWPHPN